MQATTTLFLFSVPILKMSQRKGSQHWLIQSPLYLLSECDYFHLMLLVSTKKKLNKTNISNKSIPNAYFQIEMQPKKNLFIKYIQLYFSFLSKIQQLTKVPTIVPSSKATSKSIEDTVNFSWFLTFT